MAFTSVLSLQLLTSIHLTRYFCFFTTTKIWTHCFDELFISCTCEKLDRIWRIWIWRDFFTNKNWFFPELEIEILSAQKPPITLKSDVCFEGAPFFKILSFQWWAEQLVTGPPPARTSSAIKKVNKTALKIFSFRKPRKTGKYST